MIEYIVNDKIIIYIDETTLIMVYFKLKNGQISMKLN